MSFFFGGGGYSLYLILLHLPILLLTIYIYICIYWFCKLNLLLFLSQQQSQLSRWEEWAQSLPRSPRTTLLKQITKAWTRSPFTIRTHQRVALSSEIFQVIYRHQRRYYGTLQAALVAWSRCLVLGLMDGTLDQVRRTKDQRLVAICQTIVKGKVVRIQWFYQDEEASRSLLWFTFLAINVQRGIQMGCRFIDAGPSLYNDAVQLKEKFAFSSTTSWRDHYDGPFKDAISCCDLKMGSTFPPCTHNPTTIHQNTGTSEITNRPLQDPTSAEENCLKICKQLSHPRRRHTRQKQTWLSLGWKRLRLILWNVLLYLRYCVTFESRAHFFWRNTFFIFIYIIIIYSFAVFKHHLSFALVSFLLA